MPAPLIGTVEDFPVHVMLMLVVRGIPPAHGTRSPVAFERFIFPLRRRLPAVDVVEHPRPVLALDRIQDPAEKSPGLMHHTNSMKGIDRKGGIAHPHIAIVPVA